MVYDIKSVSIDPAYVHRHAFAVAREQIGVAQENTDHATLRYCNPPAVEGESWQEECLLTAKEDVLLRDLVRPEFVAAFVEALDTPRNLLHNFRAAPQRGGTEHK